MQAMDVSKMMELQKEFCVRNKKPMFAPTDGVCWSCGRRISDNGDKLITGCEHCHRSYCD